MRNGILRGGGFFVLFVMLFCAAPALHAGEAEDPRDEPNWALQFGIWGDLTLGTFEAGDISFKQRLSPRSALRYGLSIYYNYRDGTRLSDDHVYWNDIQVIYQRYVDPEAVVKFYWGTGPYVHYRYDYRLFSTDTYYNERIHKEWGLGLRGIGGVEWFVTRMISLHAEYRVSAVYSWVRDEIEYKSGISSPVRRDSKEDQSFNLSNSRTVLFGMSVYF